MAFAARWILPESSPDGPTTLAAAMRISLPVAQILWHRGYRDPDAARAFLSPSLEHLHSPQRLHDMDAAVERILAAIRDKERILLYGDYDVDGTTSVAILASVLRLLGADPAYHIPHRLQDGYGIHADVIEREATKGTRLIISVDTGIRAGHEVALASRLGIDMVVTDHHLPDATLPPALAVLNPNRLDTSYPERVLCGAGVTLKLVQALLARSEMADDRRDRILRSLMKLVAIGTVADVVPLTGENRILVWHGLRGLREIASPGLAALLAAAGFQPGDMPTAGQVSFRIAPRMNAAGRMDDASQVVEMLLTQDATRAQEIALALDERNRQRQSAEQQMVRTILDECSARPPGQDDRGLVFSGEGWHRGVVGIVASRMVERYCRPTFVLGIDAVTGLAQGSGRSIAGFSLVDALETMPDLFERFGGHHMAAGVTLRADRVPAFVERWAHYCRQQLSVDDLRPTLSLDARLRPQDISEQTAREIEQLGPFGLGNPTPVFAIEQAEIADEPRLFAEQHLRLRVRLDGRFFSITAWRFAERQQEFAAGRLMDLAVTLDVDERSAQRGYAGWGLTLRDARGDA